MGNIPTIEEIKMMDEILEYEISNYKKGLTLNYHQLLQKKYINISEEKLISLINNTIAIFERKNIVECYEVSYKAYGWGRCKQIKSMIKEDCLKFISDGGFENYYNIKGNDKQVLPNQKKIVDTRKPLGFDYGQDK
jgi:hypothetical protein